MGTAADTFTDEARQAAGEAWLSASSWAIGPDGQFRHAGDGSADDIYRWDEVWEFTSPEMDTFGVRGSTIFPDGGSRYLSEAHVWEG